MSVNPNKDLILSESCNEKDDTVQMIAGSDRYGPNYSTMKLDKAKEFKEDLEEVIEKIESSENS